MGLWKTSEQMLALCADWDNAEVNRAAGLDSPRRMTALALRVQAQFVADMGNQPDAGVTAVRAVREPSTE